MRRSIFTARSWSHENGVALITVLLIVFLATIAATALASVQQLAARRSTLLLHQMQARQYLLGAEQWAAVILRRDRESTPTDHPMEDWAAVPPALPVEGGSLSGRIEDLQGRFNLNNLLSQPRRDPNRVGGAVQANTADGINPGKLKALGRLLELLDMDADIAQAIADWIDADQTTRFPNGAEDSQYTDRDPAYLTADRPLSSLSELRLIRGIDQASYEKLAPHVCALPLSAEDAHATPLNVNTTSALVLAAAANLELARAADIVAERPARGYSTVEEALVEAKRGNRALAEDDFSVSSRYFLVRAEVRVGSARARLSSVLQRPDGADDDYGAGAGARILLRSFGQDD